jgi:predicted HicB family RNase H-like nuclease
MRITLRLDKDLLERARAEAARRKTTLASLIEQGLDLDNSALLLDRMDGIG